MQAVEVGEDEDKDDDDDDDSGGDDTLRRKKSMRRGAGVQEHYVELMDYTKSNSFSISVHLANL